MQKIYTEFKPKGFELISVNQGDSAEVINKYIREKNWTFPIVMDTGEASTKFDVGAVPANFLVDKSGKIVWQSVGTATEKELRAALKKAGLE